jgi:hypothetical protein
LEKLEVGVAESGVMLALAGHFHNLEADRSLARLQMRRRQVKDCFILQRSGEKINKIAPCVDDTFYYLLFRLLVQWIFSLEVVCFFLNLLSFSFSKTKKSYTGLLQLYI